MSIASIIKKTPKIIFKAFKSLIDKGAYLQKAPSGFSNVVEKSYSLPIIIVSGTDETISDSAFTGKMQPSDQIGLVQGDTVTGFTIATGDFVFTSESEKLLIVEIDRVALKAMYMLLLRGAGSL